MKIPASIFAFTILMSCNIISVDAQKKFTEGKIIFDITFPDMEMDQNKMAMMPTDATMYIKNDKSRLDMKMPMGTVIAITRNDTTVTLMDMMGRKMALKTTKDDAKKMKGMASKPVVKITDETKDIAGFKCTKAIVTMDINSGKEKGTHTFNVWFTKDIEAKNSMRHQIEGIDGFMMEFAVEDRGMNMKMTARTVEQQPVDEAMFTIPEGYTEMKMDDLMKMGGGK